MEGTNEGLAAAGPAAQRRPEAEPDTGPARTPGPRTPPGQHTVSEIAGLLGVSRQTVYRALEPGTVRSAAAAAAELAGTAE